MFWKKKKPITERELILVNSLITAMKSNPDGWDVSSNYGEAKLIYDETFLDFRKTRNRFIYSPSRCGTSELTYNAAKLELDPSNLDRLDEVAFELVREKMIRSLANIGKK